MVLIIGVGIRQRDVALALWLRGCQPELPHTPH